MPLRLRYNVFPAIRDLEGNCMRNIDSSRRSGAKTDKRRIHKTDAR